MTTRPDHVQSARLAYMPGVDGLRAVSVLAVFLFHAGVLDGGFIGVDVFFVISGFLITGLAISEIERDGRLALGAFWARRARRLLPALMLVCAATLVYSIGEGGAALRRVGRDTTATILYVANWAQIGDGRDYFAAYDAPPLLQHAWSLAVEEQFYLVWPLILAAVVFTIGRRPDRLRLMVAAVATTAALASVAISFWLRSRDVGLTRLYFGTDTRAVGLAIGSIAGCYLRPANLRATEVTAPVGCARRRRSCRARRPDGADRRYRAVVVRPRLPGDRVVVVGGDDGSDGARCGRPRAGASPAGHPGAGLVRVLPVALARDRGARWRTNGMEWSPTWRTLAVRHRSPHGVLVVRDRTACPAPRVGDTAASHRLQRGRRRARRRSAGRHARSRTTVSERRRSAFPATLADSDAGQGTETSPPVTSPVSPAVSSTVLAAQRADRRYADRRHVDRNDDDDRIGAEDPRCRPTGP